MDYRTQDHLDRKREFEALAKAELYRFLNEPEEAESICHDVLAVVPAPPARASAVGTWRSPINSPAPRRPHVERPKLHSRQLNDPYEHALLSRLLNERRAKAQLRAGRPPHTLLPLLEEAMRCFAEAEKIRPAGNDEAILRWNRCVRLLQTPSLAWEEQLASYEADDAPPR